MEYVGTLLQKLFEKDKEINTYKSYKNCSKKMY